MAAKPTHSGNGYTVGARSSVGRDRKSTRLNSSHGYISYAVFCLKKKKKKHTTTYTTQTKKIKPPRRYRTVTHRSLDQRREVMHRLQCHSAFSEHHSRV